MERRLEGVNLMSANRWSILGPLFIAIAVLILGLPNGMPRAGAQSDSDEATIQNVITKFNAASEQAADMRDPTVEQPYTTSGYYSELALDMQDDWDAGIVGV